MPKRMQCDSCSAPATTWSNGFDWCDKHAPPDALYQPPHRVWIDKPLAYLAGPLSQARPITQRAHLLEAEGIGVTSRWHFVAQNKAEDPVHELERQAVLADNIEDMNNAQCCVFFGYDGVPRASLVEVGWFLALDKPVFWAVGRNGDGINLFAEHKLVHKFPWIITGPDLAHYIRSIVET